MAKKRSKRAIAVLVSTAVGLLAGGPAAAGSAERGRQIAVEHCSRCHVIPDHNPYGGIGSTPSFRILARMKDADDRIRTFYARRPHPVFIIVPGVPRLSKTPSHVQTITVTHDDVEALASYLETLKGKAR